MSGVAARALYNRLDKWEPPHVRPKELTQRVSDMNEREVLKQLASSSMKIIQKSSTMPSHQIDMTV